MADSPRAALRPLLLTGAGLVVLALVVAVRGPVALLAARLVLT